MEQSLEVSNKHSKVLVKFHESSWIVTLIPPKLNICVRTFQCHFDVFLSMNDER